MKEVEANEKQFGRCGNGETRHLVREQGGEGDVGEEEEEEEEKEEEEEEEGEQSSK